VWFFDTSPASAGLFYACGLKTPVCRYGTLKKLRREKSSILFTFLPGMNAYAACCGKAENGSFLTESRAFYL
jgi:hypothetical protein